MPSSSITRPSRGVRRSVAQILVDQTRRRRIAAGAGVQPPAEADATPEASSEETSSEKSADTDTKDANSTEPATAPTAGVSGGQLHKFCKKDGVFVPFVSYELPLPRYQFSKF